MRTPRLRKRPLSPTARGLERRADVAAGTALRGARVARNAIGTAAPAHLDVGASGGTPLPHDLRGWLEHSFDADLSSLRLHTDPAARAAVAAEGARGLAAGANVYLDLAPSELRTEPGRRLLAHEVAHTVQQAGRIDGGRLRVVPLAGSALPQLAPDFVDEVGTLASYHVPPSSLADVHAAYAAVPDVKTHLATIAAILGPTFPVSRDQLEALHKETTKPGFAALSSELKGLYIDTLKWLGAYDLAGQALVANADARTWWRSRLLYTEIHKGDLGWLPKIAAAHPFLKTYYPGRVVDAYRSAFFGPGFDPVDIDEDTASAKKGAKSFLVRLDAELTTFKTAKKGVPLIGNELEAATLVAMHFFEEDRLLTLRELRDAERTAKPTGSWAGVARAIAEKFTVDTFSVGTQIRSLYEEAQALFQGVYTPVKEAANQAVTHWKRVDAFISARPGTFENLNAAELKAIREQIKTEKRYKDLPTFLEKMASAILKRPKGNLPNAATFAMAVREQRDAIRIKSAHFGLFLADRARSGKIATTEALVLGMALQILYVFDYELGRYDAARDKKLTAKGLADERVATRLRLGRRLRDEGVNWGWTPLRDAGNAVFKEGTVISLIGEWREDKDPPAFTTDLLNAPVETLEKTSITPGLLERFASVAHWDAIAAAIDKKLRDGEPNVSEVGKPPNITRNTLVGRAIAEVGRTSLPRRFVMEPWEFGDPMMVALAVAPTTPTIIAAEDWSGLFQAHPKHKDLLALVPANEEIFNPVRPPASGTLAVWSFPRTELLAGRLATLPGLADAVKAHWVATHVASEAPPDPKAGWAWLTALGEYAFDLALDPAKAKELAAINKQIEETVEQDFQQAVRRAYDQGRLATTALRNEIRPPLEKNLRSFDRSVPRDSWIPDWAFSEIRNFGRGIWPRGDLHLQMTALVLEIGPALMEAYGPKDTFGPFNRTAIDRWWITEPLMILIWGALKTFDELDAQHTRAIDEARKKSLRDPVHPLLEISSVGEATLGDARKTLRSLLDALESEAKESQRKYGIIGRKGGGLTTTFIDDSISPIKLMMGRTSIGEGSANAFAIGDTYYEIKKIHESFSYHPRYGRREKLGIDWGGGIPPGGYLIYDGDGKEVERPSGKVLVTYFVSAPDDAKGREVDVKDNDEAALEELSRIIGNEMTHEHLVAAVKLIKTLAAWELEILEMVVPGVSEATFAATVLEIAFSPATAALLDAIREKGFGIFTEVFDAIGNLDIEELASTLIFDKDFSSPTYGNPKWKPQSRAGEAIAKRRGGIWGTLWKMLKNIFEVGLRILGGMKRLVRNAQVPIRRAQLFVLRHPGAGLVMNLLLDAWDALGDVSLSDIDELAEGVMEGDYTTRLEAAVVEGGQALLERGRDMLDTLRHLKLPETIIAKELIIDAILDLAIEALKGKWEVGAKVMRGLLDSLGIMGRIERYIGDKVLVGKTDPNTYWQNLVVSKLNPILTGLRDKFVLHLTDSFREVPILKGLTEPKGTPIDLSLGGFGFEEHPEAGGLWLPGAALGGLPASGGGRPLPPLQRARAESAFGHDFSHVRLHHDSHADRMARGLHATAMTSGSHVFLRSGLSPTHGEGQGVLHHELAHVLQQTGSRPLGADHPATPTMGAPGRGLTFDAGRESSADRAASIARPGAVASRPLGVGGRAAGVQPKLTADFMRDFLRRLGKRDDIKDAHEEVKKAAAIGVTLTAEGSVLAKSLGAALKKAIGNKKTPFSLPFKQQQDKLQEIAKKTWPELEKSLPVLIDRATEDVPAANRTSDDPNKTVRHIDPDQLLVHLERELFGVTGMAMVLKLKTKKGTDELRKQEVVDGTAPLISLEVEYVDLPVLLPGKETDELWDLFVNDSFAPKGKKLVASDLASWREATKLVLGRGNPAFDTYDRTDFKLSERKAKVVRGQRERIGEVVKIGWPSPKDYVQTDLGQVSKKGPRDIGLRLGTYDEAVPGIKKSIPDRDAHHTVQFLLIEYFHNVKKTRMPFPHLKSVKYPGITASGGLVDKIKGNDATLDVGTYYPNRGGKMPTVYISRHTHQSGIHYRTEKGDDDGSKSTSTGSQGIAIERAFRNHLGPYKGVMKEKPLLESLAEKAKSKKDNDPLDDKAAKAYLPTVISVKRVSDATVVAAQKTYAEMWKEMQTKLRRKLIDQEVPYYNAAAREKGLKDQLDATTVLSTFPDIVKRTEEIIGHKAGFAGAKGP